MKNKKIIEILKERPTANIVQEKLVSDNLNKPKDSIVDIKSEKIFGNIVDE